MRKLNRVIAAGALAVPVALGAWSVAGAAEGSSVAQDSGGEDLVEICEEVLGDNDLGDLGDSEGEDLEEICEEVLGDNDLGDLGDLGEGNSGGTTTA